MSLLSAHQFPLKKIFSDDFQFLIPEYQRPYSWGVEQAEELLTDLTEYMDSYKDTPVPEMPEYFLGSIVLIKKDGFPESEVVDGQQRLTTLTILLSVLRELSANEDVKNSLGSYVLQKANLLEGTQAKYRLSLRKRDNDHFRTHIQDPGGLEKLTEDLDLTDAKLNITRNAMCFTDALIGKDQEYLQSLASFLAMKCVLVVVSTPDFDSAFRIFSVLNSRGLDLTATDLLKADIIGQIQETDRDQYTQKWDSLEEKLGRQRFGELFGHIRMIHRRQKPKGTLRKEFTESVKYQSPEQFVDGMLEPYGRAFGDIVSASFSSAQDAYRVNGPLKWLNRLQFSDWMPPAIEFLTRHRNQSVVDVLAPFFADLERLAHSMLIRKVGINDRIERFSKLTDEVIKGADLSESSSALQLSMREMSQTLSALEGPLYETHSPRALSTLLLRIDGFLVDAGAEYDVATVTVEHVLPQNPKPESEWVQWIDKPSDRTHWVDRLGNLTLLDRKRNSSASNYDLKRKLESYFLREGKTSPFAMTFDFKGATEWNVGTLSNRQKRLIEAVESGYRLEEGRAYKSSVKVSAQKGSTTVAQFRVTGFNGQINGLIDVTEEGLVLRKGAKGRYFHTEAGYSYRTLRDQLISDGKISRNGDDIEVLEDIVFESPSAVSGVLLGRNDNGMRSLRKVDTGENYRAWLNSLVAS